MPTVADLVAEHGLAESCITVPSVTPGVCAVCHGCVVGTRYDGTPWPVCWSCNSVMKQLTAPCQRVVPVSLCRKAPSGPTAVSTGSQLYYWLCRYKSGWSDESDRRLFSVRLVVILAHFIDLHLACVTGSSGCDVMTVVPSTKPERARGNHPLHRILTTLTGLPAPVEVLLDRGPGSLERLHPTDDGYVPIDTDRIAGRRIVLLDDTFASGTKSQAAASALNLAGGNIVGIVPIGRLIEPDYVAPGVAPADAEHRKYWSRQLATPFSFDTCCIEP